MSRMTTIIKRRIAKTTTDMYAISLMLRSIGFERCPPGNRLLLGITAGKRAKYGGTGAGIGAGPAPPPPVP